jgi:carbamoyltransferase
MYILGINAYHGDAAAALVKDGELIAAVEEERFNRVKHCAGFPARSIEYCLRAAGIGIQDIDHAGVSRKPSAHAHKRIMAIARGNTRAHKQRFARTRMSATAAQSAFAASAATAVERAHLAASDYEVEPNGNGRRLARTLADRFRNVLKTSDTKAVLANAFGVSPAELRARFHKVEHHRAHLASAFYVSPFTRAALLSLDGFGDSISTMWGLGDGAHIKVLGQVEYPHSLGIVYTATSQFLGFPHYGDEGKVMGLAPYGSPRFIDKFRRIIRTEPQGRFSLELDYFRYVTEGVSMSWDDGSPVIGPLFSERYEHAFGRRREPDSQLTSRECDIAASLQARLEEVAFHILDHLHDATGLTDLGLAGGVAYNSVMNGKILRHTPFRRLFVQPAAGDSGTAIGVCYQIWNEQRAKSQEPRAKSHSTCTSVNESALSSSPLALGSFTGPEFTNDEIRKELQISDLKFETCPGAQLFNQAAADIANGLVVGWFQGRMEFGPRALGNRSILADPRKSEMKDILNQRIKKREPFRPFAPSILAEYVGEYFEQTHPSPAMLMVYQVKAARRAEIPAVTHVDGSGRVQTVTRLDNERFYHLIQAFHKLTGVPVVLNTSFNENEPIVCTPRDAIDCFLKTRIDVLYLGNCVVRREGSTKSHE